MIKISKHNLIEVHNEISEFSKNENEEWIIKHSVFRELDNPSTKVIIAINDSKKIVGYSLLTNRSVLSTDTNMLYFILVGKDYRRKKICSLLIRESLKINANLWSICDESKKNLWEKLGAKTKLRDNNEFEIWWN